MTLSLPRHRVVLLLAALVMAATGAPAHAQENAAWVEVSAGGEAVVESDFSPPGTLLLSSTREEGVISGRVDRARLFMLRGGALSRVRHPEEELGPTSAALSMDGQRILVDAGGQVVYLVAAAQDVPPLAMGSRLPPLSFAQTDTYLSVALAADGRALLTRPAPAGMTLVSPGSGESALPYLGSRPAISPDGQLLAFGYRQEGALVASIFLGATDGSAPPTKLTDDDIFESASTWLSDSEVAYVAAADPTEIRAWNRDSGRQRLIARMPTGYGVSDLVAAPDGGWIAYTFEERSTLHRRVRIVPTAGPGVQFELAKAGTWNDRILGWAAQ